MSSDVFISYSSKDAAVADAACAAIEAAGAHCWIAPRDIYAGEDWPGAILRGIHSSRVMVLIFSGNANTSNQIKREVERAVSRGMPVIPFRIENLQPSPNLEFFISTPHWLDAYPPPMEEHFAALAQAVQRLLEKPPEEAPPGVAAGGPASRGAGYVPVRRLERARSGRGAPVAALLVLVAILFGIGGWWFGIEKGKRAVERQRMVEKEQQDARLLAEAEKAKADADRAEAELEQAKLAAAAATPQPTAAPQAVSYPAAAVAPTPEPPPPPLPAGGYVFPDTSNRYLSRGDLVNLTADQLWRWRNEIYARYGLIFSSDRGRELVESLGNSYFPRDADQDRVYDSMTAADKANVDLIRAAEGGQ